MKKILRLLKHIRILNFFRRIYRASKYFNGKYLQILKWGFKSNEYTNFTYHLTDDNLITLAQTVSLVTKKEYSEILGYLKEADDNGELKEHIINATNNSTEKKFADKEIRFGRRLGWYAFARALKPKVIIETGIDKGLGSVLLCCALEKNAQEGYDGFYYGTDINPRAGYLLSGKYEAYGQILYGDSIESLKKFEGRIDLFINDSDHSADYEAEEYDIIENKLSSHAIILGDNAHCTDKLLKFSLNKNRYFVYFQEKPKDHWYPGAGMGISFKEMKSADILLLNEKLTNQNNRSDERN